jgi:hypothetical protein
MRALRVRNSWVALFLAIGGCRGTDGPGSSPGPVLEHYTVTGTLTLDTTIATVGPPLGTVTTVTDINTPFVGELAVQLPYGGSVEATMTCNMCDFNYYTTANHLGPRVFSADSVNLFMTILMNDQPQLVLEGVRVAETVTGKVHTAYSTSTSHRRWGTFSAARHQ